MSDLGIFQDLQVKPFEKCCFLFRSTGYIVWRRGTGGNVELLHLKVFTPGHGHGQSLLSDMIRMLSEDPPYATVFGFTRTINDEAQSFYARHGFTLTKVAGIYADGDAVIFSQKWQSLVARFMPSPVDVSS